jgi:3-methyladenine DNA glycosylase/8-oxoguanine DNA glycosylase
VVDGSITLDRSRALDEQVATVARVPGLGPWTAQYLALRLGESDAFPASDLGLRRSLAAHTRTAMTARMVEEMAERWRPWRAQAAIHLWLTPRAVHA